MIPKWMDQLKDCHHCINRIVYEFGWPVTFENCMILATYGIHPYRFAAMCMQVFKNGRPVTFADTYFADE